MLTSSSKPVIKSVLCVVRPVRPGDEQFVPVREVPFLNAGEPVFRGQFSCTKENHGPSGSHQRTICLPIGKLTESVIPAAALSNGKLVDDAELLQCVLREVEPGDTQYRPIGDVKLLNDGERLFTGIFRTHSENHGPSGSHSLLVALPLGDVTESVYNQVAA